MLLLAALGAAAAQAAGPASSPAARPLDLTLPRDAGQWTGVASRVQQQERQQAVEQMQAERGQSVRTRLQPYGTGYEARMSRQAAGAAFGAAGPAAASPGAQGGAGGAPRGGAGKGR